MTEGQLLETGQLTDLFQVDALGAVDQNEKVVTALFIPEEYIFRADDTDRLICIRSVTHRELFLVIQIHVVDPQVIQKVINTLFFFRPLVIILRPALFHNEFHGSISVIMI